MLARVGAWVAMAEFSRLRLTSWWLVTKFLITRFCLLVCNHLLNRFKLIMLPFSYTFFLTVNVVCQGLFWYWCTTKIIGFKHCAFEICWSGWMNYLVFYTYMIKRSHRSVLMLPNTDVLKLSINKELVWNGFALPRHKWTHLWD